MASAARKAAEVTARYLLGVAEETNLGSFEEELVDCIRALLAEQHEVRNLPCIAGCPKTPVCDETYPDPELPDHCERCHHPLVCHPAEPSRPAPPPARDEVHDALAEIVEWVAGEGPCSCAVDAHVECWLCRWHGRATAALARLAEVKHG